MWGHLTPTEAVRFRSSVCVAISLVHLTQALGKALYLFNICCVWPRVMLLEWALVRFRGQQTKTATHSTVFGFQWALFSVMLCVFLCSEIDKCMVVFDSQKVPRLKIECLLFTFPFKLRFCVLCCCQTINWKLGGGFPNIAFQTWFPCKGFPHKLFYFTILLKQVCMVVECRVTAKCLLLRFYVKPSIFAFFNQNLKHAYDLFFHFSINVKFVRTQAKPKHMTWHRRFVAVLSPRGLQPC